MKPDEFKSLVETLSKVIDARAKTTETLIKGEITSVREEIKASEDRLRAEIKASEERTQAEILAARAEAKADHLQFVNNGCKILNSARIKLPSAGRIIPTGKK